MKSDKKLPDDKARDNARIYRKLYGVETDQFELELIDEQFPTSKWWGYYHKVNHKLRPSSNGKFYANLKDILDTCIQKGYIEPNKKTAEAERLKVTDKGKDLISRFYWIKAFYRNKHTQQAINEMIRWGAPVLALWIAHFFYNISFLPK